MFQRTFDGSYQYPSRSIERDLACEAFSERAEADDQICDNLSSAFFSNICAAAPRNKGGIVPDVCHNGKELLGTIRKRRLFFVVRHTVSLLRNNIGRNEARLAVVDVSGAVGLAHSSHTRYLDGG